MQTTNLLQLPAAGAAKPKRSEPKPAAQPHDVLVTLAELLPRFSADREAAEAALDEIENRVRPRISPKTPDHANIVSGPLPEELEAQRRFDTRQRQDAAPAKASLERCREREAAAYFAGECLALREAMKAAAPVIEARILECREAAELDRRKVRDAIRTATDLRARRDSLQAQRDGVSSRQGEVDKAQARLATAADAGR